MEKLEEDREKRERYQAGTNPNNVAILTSRKLSFKTKS